jgi:hypothetical protein
MLLPIRKFLGGIINFQMNFRKQLEAIGACFLGLEIAKSYNVSFSCFAIH